MTTARSRNGGGYALLGPVVAAWGVNWPIMKIGLADISPLWLVVVRLAIAVACLFGVLAAQGRLKLPHRHDRPVIFTIGLLHLCGAMALMHVALTMVDAGRSALLAYTTPIFVAPLGVAVLGERLNAWRGWGAAAGVAGMAVMFNPLEFDFGDAEAVLGNALLLLAALCWSLAIIHVRAHRFHGDALQATAWAMVIAIAPVSVAAALSEPLAAINWSPTLFVIIAYNGVVATAFGFWAVVALTSRLPALTTSLGMLATPVIGYLSSLAWLGERLTAADSAGLALIVCAVACVAVGDARARGDRAPA